MPFLDFTREGQSNSIAYLLEIRNVDMNKIIDKKSTGMKILITTGFCKEPDDWVILFEFRLRRIIEIIDKEIITNFKITCRTLKLLVKLLVEVRVDLTELKEFVSSKEIKEQLKWAINGIDIVGCELAQNIAKKL